MRQNNNALDNCHEIITSEDYVDIYALRLLPDVDIEEVAEEAGAECIQKITDKDYIFHIKVGEGACREFYNSIPYLKVPNIYTLSSLSSIEAAGIGPVLKSEALDLSGNGVIIGIIDTGIDYTHEAFIYEDNTSKIISIWDQTQAGSPPDGFQYGTEYTDEQINEALESETPLSLVPTGDEIGHGTYIAGISAGRPNRKKNFSGAAPNADLIIVKLKESKKCILEFFEVKEDAIAFQSNDILQGLNYIIKKARELKRPVVVLFTGASNEGPHNGDALPERVFAEMGRSYGVIIVLAAGNEANASHHFHGVFEKKEKRKEVQLNIAEMERGLFISLWSRLPDELEIEIISPSGETTDRVPAISGKWQKFAFPIESTEILIDYELIEERTAEEAIYIKIINPTSGLWTLVIYGEIIINKEFNIWLPVRGLIDDNTIFLKPSPDTTIVNPAANKRTITVGAFNDVINSIYVPSSRGYTTENLVKPDIVAPGVNVFGPYPKDQYGVMSGTSVSAAMTAGASALLLEWGIIKGNQPALNTMAAKTHLARGAMRRTGITYPNREWGYGELDLLNTFKIIER
ncbi:S8 family peptidase [Vallitalea okinawensis]|uniref:S8 family peptidase n=1 Tax=Vallitalea okinawensis TaxID=2078660 RepID=UPI001478A228|nr:S8 family peptidase [Vallitalea okinawensis]